MEQWESTVQYWYPECKRDFLKPTVMLCVNFGLFTKIWMQVNNKNLLVLRLSGAIGQLLIQPKQRKQGLGKILFRHMYDCVKSKGLLPFAVTQSKEDGFAVKMGLSMDNRYFQVLRFKV